MAFVACDTEPGSQPETQFAGGFAVREPVCLPVDVTWAGGTAQAMLDFGTGRC